VEGKIRGWLYKNEKENLYKVIGMLLSRREIRGDLYKRRWEIYTSCIVYDLLLGGYGVTCIKMQEKFIQAVSYMVYY